MALRVDGRERRRLRANGRARGHGCENRGSDAERKIFHRIDLVNRYLQERSCPALKVLMRAGPIRETPSFNQSNRMAMGQLIEKPALPKGLPPGPVRRPSCTRVRMWNSSRNCSG